MDRNQVLSHIIRVDLTIPLNKDDELHENALKIARMARKDWRQRDDLHVSQVSGGNTNVLLECHPELEPNDRVLVRVHGQNTELFINRRTEEFHMQLLHEKGLGAPLYLAFNNGICYGYSPGVVPSIESVRSPHMSELIAKKMAQVHAIPYTVDGENKEAKEMMVKFLELVPESFGDEALDKRYRAVAGSKTKLTEEVIFITRLLPRIKSDIVLCHNDLLNRNIIYQPQKDDVMFIDYEYAGLNYQAFDIANHMCEYCGIEDYTTERYPSKEHQRFWIRHYLNEYNRLKKRPAPTNDAIEQMLNEVAILAMASCLMWTLWSLIQTEHSTLEADFMKLAEDRLQLYYILKQDVTSTTN